VTQVQGPRRGRRLVVEFCGLPGCGKTTLARTVAEILRAEGREAVVVDEAVSAATPTLLRLPRKIVMVGRAVAAAPRREPAAGLRLAATQRNRRDRLAVPVQWWMTQRLLTTAARGRGTAVVEEGLMQALWTAGLLASGPVNVPELVGLAAAVPARADLVVHLDVPVELAAKRLGSRSSRHSRVQRMPESERLDALRAGADLMDELLAQWTSEGLGRVVVADGGTADPASTVLAWIRQA
jgi:thymidylate kinase